MLRLTLRVKGKLCSKLTEKGRTYDIIRWSKCIKKSHCIKDQRKAIVSKTLMLAMMKKENKSMSRNTAT